VGQIEEERAIAVGVDEALGFTRQVVLTLAAFDIARCGRRLAGMENIEPLLARRKAGLSEVPLANHRGRIPGAAQVLGEGLLLERQLLSHRRMEQLLRGRVRSPGNEGGQVKARRKAPRHDGRPRR